MTASTRDTCGAVAREEREPLPRRYTAGRQGRERASLGIRDLLSYRLHVVANLLSRGAELRYRREFGVNLWEWRTLAFLGAVTEALSLSHLAHAAGIHKSQMSRVVSGLATRKLVVRSTNTKDARGVQLALSKSGRRLYEGLISAAAERDRGFRSCLTSDEKRNLESVLAKLAGRAREFIQQERK